MTGEHRVRIMTGAGEEWLCSCGAWYLRSLLPFTVPEMAAAEALHQTHAYASEQRAGRVDTHDGTPPGAV